MSRYFWDDYPTSATLRLSACARVSLGKTQGGLETPRNPALTTIMIQQHLLRGPGSGLAGAGAFVAAVRLQQPGLGIVREIVQ